jgi:hypothetical protein
MALKVIGAGLGRTGTMSLKYALEHLGFGKSYTIQDLFARPEHVRVWDAARQGKPVDWDSLFTGYQSTVDCPGSAFYESLMKHYPDAKVILTVRDPERWYDGMRQSLYYLKQAYPPWLAFFAPRMGRLRRFFDALIWETAFSGRFDDRLYAIDQYVKASEAIKQSVPPERLLVYDLRDGWAPLCTFLEVPVPAGRPLPHLNDGSEFRERIRRSARKDRKRALAMAGAFAFVLVVAAALMATRLGFY